MLRRLHLLRALRIVVRADSDPVRQTLFANLRESHLHVRLVFALHERIRGSLMSAVLVSLYGLAALLTVSAPRNRRARILTVAKHINARRHVGRIAGLLAPRSTAPIEITMWVAGRRLFPTAASLLAAPRVVARALRILRVLDDRHGFLVACRAAAAMAWYVRGLTILRDRQPAAILVGSDSNPEEVGFAAAARAQGVATIFASHAYPTPFSPPLDFSLSILVGEAELDARRLRGAIGGDVVVIGLEGESRPLDMSRFARSAPVIGIFTPKAIAWPTLATVIADCRQHYHARRIVIRWHPSMIEPPRLASHVGDLTAVIESPRAARLADVAEQCDWVIADENSTVHLSVLKLGIPSVALRLGRYPDTRSDMYGFVREHIVPPVVESISELRADTLAAFFAEGWTTRFRQYDASYGQPGEVIEASVRAAVRRVCGDVNEAGRG